MDIPSYLLGKSAGGSGGTSNYTDLTNKPSINSVELIGNKTLADLGIPDGENVYIIEENSSSNPFVFDGKKKGLYLQYNFSAVFYYKLYENDSVRKFNGNFVVQLYLSNDFSYIEGQTSYSNVGKLLYFTSTNELRIGNQFAISSGSISPSYNSLGWLLTNSAQTIAGVKTFSSIPKQNNTTAPTSDKEFTNKKYVDDQISGIAGGENVYVIENTSSEPFIFDGKKKGLYIINVHTNDTSFYYRLTENSTIKVLSGYINYIYIPEDYVYDVSEPNKSAGIMNRITFSNGVPTTQLYYFKIIFSNNAIVENYSGNNQTIQVIGRYLTTQSQIIEGVKDFWAIPTLKSNLTPTTDYQLVNKKYVDDKPTTYAGYDATKTQVLKNINGTLTWVDEV